MVGHVQRRYWHDDPDERHERYEAYELSFPAFGGQSGSPICLREVPNPYRHRVAAIVTNSFPYFAPDRPMAAFWAVGLVVGPFSDWIGSSTQKDRRGGRILFPLKRTPCFARKTASDGHFGLALSREILRRLGASQQSGLHDLRFLPLYRTLLDRTATAGKTGSNGGNPNRTVSPL